MPRKLSKSDLVSQVVAEGESLRAARGTAAQLGKFDRAHVGRGQEIYQADSV